MIGLVTLSLIGKSENTVSILLEGGGSLGGELPKTSLISVFCDVGVGDKLSL